MKSKLVGKILLTVFVLTLAFVFVQDITRPRTPQLGVLGKKETGCTTIQDGTLERSDGALIVTNYDEWGYNYQAHIFNGMYCDAYRDVAWCQGYKDINLLMKWNDSWLANKDCDGDKLLDRYYGHPSYIGSGAWLTNHQSGTYIGEDDKEHRWTYFVKIVAKPTSDYDCVEDGGREIWGSFCEIQSVSNDPYAGYHGLEFKAGRPGLGNW